MEIDLLVDYPKVKRNVKREKSEEQIKIAKMFDWRYFDMRIPHICYDGYSYDGRWIPVVKKFIEYYNLKPGDSVLDLGMAKGFMLYDFKQVMPSLRVVGIDISQYAVNCCPPEVEAYVGNAKNLGRFLNKEFDLVICINTIHNLGEVECRQAVREIQRVGKKAFITVDAYRTLEEKERMFDWNITAETVLSTDGWKKLYEEEEYTGDYFWFIP